MIQDNPCSRWRQTHGNKNSSSVYAFKSQFRDSCSLVLLLYKGTWEQEIGQAL
jgi:hypothetical protein